MNVLKSYYGIRRRSELNYELTTTNMQFNFGKHDFILEINK